MFILLDKEKVSSYIVLLSTIIILFVFSVMLKPDDIIATSIEDIEANDIEITNDIMSNNIGNQENI